VRMKVLLFVRYLVLSGVFVRYLVLSGVFVTELSPALAVILLFLPLIPMTGVMGAQCWLLDFTRLGV
jgi:hypothetical protein